MEGEAVAMPDRAAAIRHAISTAAPNDVILIAGKGHENYQVIGDRTIAFSDVETARDCLASRGGIGK
jgi:UDP-N-acetylmuramoyl-L-alanyl-D-glutamate--2,6-diaminopimelate ligase